MVSTEDDGNQCPKCKLYSGEDWSQCEGRCPMEGSPHYDPVLSVEYSAMDFPEPERKRVWQYTCMVHGRLYRMRTLSRRHHLSGRGLEIHCP